MQQQYEMPRATCPYCHYGSNADASANDPTLDNSNPRPPAPGDFTICFGCTGVCVYTKEFQLRKPTVAEWQEVLANPVYFACMKAVQREIARLNPFHSRLSH